MPASETQENKLLVPLAVAASMLSLSRQTLYNWSYNGALPFASFRIGGRRMVRRADLEAYVAGLAGGNDLARPRPADPALAPAADPTAPPRRSRGRPRKTATLNAAGGAR